MDENGWLAAELAYRRSRELSAKLSEAKTLEEARDTWSDFLVQHNRIFTKLEQESKFGNIGPWYGNIKKKRRESAHLSYLHHARNVDEHGLAATYETAQASVSIGAPGERIRGSLSVVNNKVAFSPLAGSKPPSISVRPDRLDLVPVTDRGVRHDPPIDPKSAFQYAYSPSEISFISTQLAKEIIEEARSMIVQKL